MPDIRLAAAIAVVDDRVLLVQRSLSERFLPGVWGVPCGKVDIDRGEKPREAVIRELLEETGLAGEVVRFVGRTNFTSVFRGRRVRNHQRNYLVRPVADGDRRRRGRRHYSLEPEPMPEVTLPSKDQSYEWVPAGQVEFFNGIDPYNLKVIRQGLKRMKE
jgi:8-oxo-dGTP diphosphatase